mgnify:FL=1
MVLCWIPFRITIQFLRRFFGRIIESDYNGDFGGGEVTPSVIACGDATFPKGTANPLSHA